MRRIALILYLSRRLIIGFLLILILVGLFIILLLSQKFEITSVQLEATNYNASYKFEDEAFMKELQLVLDEDKYQKTRNPSRPLYKLTVKRRLGTRIYFLNDSKELYRERKKFVLNEKINLRIAKVIERIEDISPYGELLPWEKVDDVLPKYAKATIRDLETGLGFNVQRRAGSKHADVQPLTKGDTAIYKTIYGGKWSWQRRAVIVEIDGRKIAASMNGMPHGAGAIDGNNFPGHSCLHFLGTRVHGSNKVDLAHQIMVWKSAGKFEEFLASQKSEIMPEILFTIMDQKDKSLLKAVVTKEKELEKLVALMAEFSRVKLDKLELKLDEKDKKTFQGQVKTVSLKQKETVNEFSLVLIENRQFHGWIIESLTLK